MMDRPRKSSARLGESTDGLLITKVFNNNVVVASSEDGEEKVLMGRGLGFQRRRGDAITAGTAEKVFVLEDGAERTHITEMLASVPIDVVEAVDEAITVAEQRLGHDLGRHLPIAVIDHIQFLISRLDEGVRIPTNPSPELTVLYPDEFAAAQAMREIIGTRLGRSLPEEETVFLTMHLLTATLDEENGNAAQLVRHVRHVVDIVETSIGRDIDRQGIDYSRFVLHVKFLLQRLVSERMLRAADSSFFEFARKSYPGSYGVATRVREYVMAATGELLTDEEMLYLIVHVERLDRATGSPDEGTAGPGTQAGPEQAGSEQAPSEQRGADGVAGRSGVAPPEPADDTGGATSRSVR